MGALDLLPLLVGLRTENAPKSQTGGQPLILGQNHSSQLLQEMERGNLETLILLDSPKLPQQSRFIKALKSLSCSVVLSDVENEYTVSPTLFFLEVHHGKNLTFYYIGTLNSPQRASQRPVHFIPSLQTAKVHTKS